MLIKWSLLTFGLISGCSSPLLVPEIFERPAPRENIIPTAAKSLLNFQSQVVNNDENYHLGTGDEIMIEVWGYPELSGKHVIGPDGRITLPLIGPVRLASLSREKAAEFIKASLVDYYTELSVAVRVDRYASNRVLVLGRVARPGEVNFGMTHPTLLEAISLAGGFEEASGLTGQANSLPHTYCAIFRGREQIVWVELEPLLTGRDLSLNLKLQRNDVIYIPDIEERLVYVLGEVRQPGAFRLTPGMSFVELLAKAGGPTRDAALGRINIIRPGQSANKSVALKQLTAPSKKANIGLKEGDIIYVPINTIAKVNYAIQFLNPFTTLLGIYANITSIRADTQRRRLDQEKENLEAERAAIEAEREANAGFE